MTWSIILARNAVKSMDRLAENERKRVANAILLLKENPKPPGKKVKPLKAIDGELLRLRVGNTRVIYEIVEDEIHVLGIVKRGDLERWLRQK